MATLCHNAPIPEPQFHEQRLLVPAAQMRDNRSALPPEGSFMRRSSLVRKAGFLCVVMFAGMCLADDAPDLGGVREEHVVIPMRDGARSSAYLYFPDG